MWLILGPPHFKSGLFAAMRQAFFIEFFRTFRRYRNRADYIEMVDFANIADIISKYITEEA